MLTFNVFCFFSLKQRLQEQIRIAIRVRSLQEEKGRKPKKKYTAEEIKHQLNNAEAWWSEQKLNMHHVKGDSAKAESSCKANGEDR